MTKILSAVLCAGLMMSTAFSVSAENEETENVTTESVTAEDTTEETTEGTAEIPTEDTTESTTEDTTEPVTEDTTEEPTEPTDSTDDEYDSQIETVSIEPQYPIHGNKCGILYIMPEIDRDIAVKVTQLTQEGPYEYYNTVIPAGGEKTGSILYGMVVEGKDDVSYEIEFGVAKFKGSDEYQYITHEFTVSDTDNIVAEVVNGYIYTYTVARNDELEVPELTDTEDVVKTEDNYYVSGVTFSFPASDITPGDVNFDEKVDLYDVIDIARYLMNPASLNESQIAAGDYNLDGRTDLYDAIDIAKLIMGV